MKGKLLIFLALLTVALTVMLSGCSGGGEDLEGKYTVTFDMNGGQLDLKSTSVSSINYAYDPDAYIIDPANFNNYKIARSGYVFTGWYTSAECKPEEMWDFKTNTLATEKTTLYAGWVKEIVFSYTVCYTEGTEVKTLGSYKVEKGKEFEDYRGYSSSRQGYTVYGFYKDAACTMPWDFSTTHPGGDVDTDIPVYVNYIEGNWVIVNTYKELKDAIGRGNIYLDSDIDCGGEELFFSGTFSGIFEGNGHTISNFTVPKKGTIRGAYISLFETISDEAVIQNVNFDGVTYDFSNIDTAKVSIYKVAALARTANGGTVKNVSIKGKLVTNSTATEIANISTIASDGADKITAENFTTEIVVEANS